LIHTQIFAIPASFLVFLLEEREACFKQLQLVSGVKPYIYWTSNFAWDLLNYLIPCLLCLLLFLAFNVQAYVSAVNLPCLALLLLLYGWACVPLMYPLNYLFKVPSTAFVVSSSLNVFVGVVTVNATIILDQLGRDDEDLANINDVIKPIFVVLFPHYCLGRGLVDLALLYRTYEVEFFSIFSSCLL
jgi:ATP-binding cassette subfamily A (ABC1) protein 1